MSDEIVKAGGNGHGIVRADEWTAMREQANTLIRSGFLPKGVDTPEKAIAIMLAGRELGIPPMRAIRTLFVVDGRVGMEAKLMMGLVFERLAGATLKVVESTDVSCTVLAGRPGDEKPASFVFTIDDAKRAGLSDKDVWKKWPRDMLRNRAVSEACRAVFPDVTGGAYTPEELEPFSAAPIDYDDPEPLRVKLEAAQTRKQLNEAAAEVSKLAKAGRISSNDRDSLVRVFEARAAQVS